jgi:demethylmenaquinone methyltransferase/2-methoxy-6-polyprenyl-1,4-benzoquinol methylase
MSEQPNNQKLDRAEMSSVWKDGGNERFGLKLDLVRHLLQQREEPQWMRCKKQLIDTLSLEKSTESLVIVDVGCGLGLDSIEMAKELARSPYGGKVIGIDFNSQMINYAKESLSEVSIPANVTVEFQKADLTTLSNFSDGSVDVVRADITLQHVDLDAALKQIARILKPGGRFVSLEGTSGSFNCKDEYVSTTYNKLMPSVAGASIQLYFKLKDYGFTPQPMQTFPIVNDGSAMIRADPDWVKLKGLGNMMVQKQLLTAEEAETFISKYTAAAEKDEILSLGFVMLQLAIKN